MADLKISQLGSIVTVVPATDVLPVVQGGTTYKVTPNQLLGAGGVATLASATITGAATVGTTLGVTGDFTVGTSPFALKVFPATNRVLINQAAAIQGDALEVTAKTNGGAISLFGRASDNLATIAFRSNGAATQKGAIYCNDTGFEFVTGASTLQQTINSSTGDVTVSTGNLVMGTSGKGIDFGVTTPDGTGTVTAELLNDYEEGTWTGTMTGSTTNPTVPVTATGKYTKIGRQVTVVIYFANVSTVGASGGVAITGLPFTEDGGRAVGAAGFYNFDFNGGTGPIVDVSGSTLGFLTQLTNSSWRDVNHSAGLTRYLRATATYNV